MKWSPEDWARLGVAIRNSREAQGYSRKRLSEWSGISEKSIQLAEEGRVPTRWPKSLDVLESALAWKTGLMTRILDGYNPEAELDNSTVAAGGANYGPDLTVETSGGAPRVIEVKHAQAKMRPTNDWWFRQMDHLDLPEEIRQVLPQAAFFATTSVMHGAPEWLASAYTNTVYMMVEEVHQKRTKDRHSDQEPSTTVEESEQRISELQAEINRVRATAQAMELTLKLDEDEDPESGQDADHQEMREQLQQLNERLDALSSD